MAPKDMPWLRLYSEARRDPKIRKAAQCANVSFIEAFGFWTALLTLAGESPIRGMLLVTLQERFTIDDIAYECNTDVSMVQKLIEAFQRYNMVAVRTDEIIVIVNWEKRQFASDNSTERVRKHREKGQCNDEETFHYASASASEYGSESNSDSSSSEEPAPPPASYSDDAQLETIYRAVTSQITIPSTVRENALTALRAVLAEKRTVNDAIFYLQPFWSEWKDGRHYQQTNAGWLTDWAVSGQIPPPKTQPDKTPTAPPSKIDLVDAAFAARRAKQNGNGS